MIKLVPVINSDRELLISNLMAGKTYKIMGSVVMREDVLHYDKKHIRNPFRYGLKAWDWRGLRSLHEITEPHWYDNIPDIGIPCWVWDFTGQDRVPRMVFNKSVKNGFIAGAVYWNHATPILPSECYQEPV